MIVIVGGGYAGAATAWALARRGVGRTVTLLEAEPAAGLHASGRNAGLIGAMLEEDEALVEMAVRGARLLGEGIDGGAPPMVACGSARLVTEGAMLDAMLKRARDVGAAVEVSSTSALARGIPLLDGATSPLALRCAADGKIDPQALVGRYIGAARAGGARVVTGARVTGWIRRAGRLAGVETTAGSFQADWVVDAAGAWAGQLAASAGLSELGLVSYRRHLFESVPMKGVDPSWPWVWDLPHDVYYRVDGYRLLFCPCDVEPHPPGAPEVSQAVRTQLAVKLAAALPALVSVQLAASRACLRTFAPDRRYIVGPDPRLSGFFWIAGLGGTGATAGAAVGELAADLLIGTGAPPACARHFEPARLIGRASGES